MNQPPNSSNPRPNRSRYQPIREIGRDGEAKTVTYLGKDNAIDRPIILQRFYSDKSDYQAYQLQIQGLRELNHPGIPRYLDCFPTPDGFCLVQESKQAKSLAESNNFTPAEIKRIGIAVLEILVYLQQQNPPVIHGKIEPGNILIDENFNVYLVNFGLTAMTAATSRTLTSDRRSESKLAETKDLYGLGLTLICLLTKTKYTEINTLIDSKNRINLQNLTSQISLRWIEWLEKMAAPSSTERYSKAAAALKALKPIDAISIPEVRFSAPILEVKATKLGEKITQNLTVSNTNLDTILQGNLSVAPASKDPRRQTGSHAWISFDPPSFQSNRCDCKITIDTSKLMADKTYDRQILLYANSAPEPHSLTMRVKTPPLNTLKLPIKSLAFLLLIAAVSGMASAAVIGQNGVFANWLILMLGLIIGGVGGWTATFSSADLLKRMIGAIGTVAGIIGFVPVMGADVDVIAGFFLGLIVAALGGVVVKNHLERNFTLKLATQISLLTAGLGMSLGTEFVDGFLPFIMLALAGTGIPLTLSLSGVISQNKSQIDRYRKNEKYLIKP